MITRRQGEDKRLLAAMGKADAKAAEAIRAAIADLDTKLDAIDKASPRISQSTRNFPIPSP